jgi:hypothetical protein
LDSKFKELVAWGKAHPAIAGVLVFLAGYIFLRIYLGSGSSSSSSSGSASSDINAYYAAASAQATAGAAEQIANTQATAQTQLASMEIPVLQQAIAANENTTNAQTAAAVNLGQAQLNTILQENQNQETQNLTLIAAAASPPGSFSFGPSAGGAPMGNAGAILNLVNG